VIAIIGILATLAVIALQQARQNARDAKRVADVKQLSTALELYFNDNQSYPDTIEDLQVEGYMEQLPEAPIPADEECLPEENEYAYTVDAERGDYKISFCTGKKVSDMSPGVLCMTPGGLTTNCSYVFPIPDPDPLCNPTEEVTFVDADGDGYYDIHTCCELSAIRNNTSADYELVNNLDCSNSENWVQDISGDTYSGFVTIMNFSGNLNGNNNTIEGLYFTNNSGGYITLSSPVGLLDVPSGADVSVSNLNIDNSKIVRSTGGYAAFIAPSVEGNLSIDNSSVVNSFIQQTGGGNSGGFVGSIDGSLSIDNSYVSGLDVDDFVGSGFGGLAGIFTTSSSNNSITNSRVVNSEIVGLGCGGLGGIAQQANNLTIENSYVSGVDFDNGACSGSGGIAFIASYVDVNNSYVKDSNFLIPGNGSGGAGGGYAGFFVISSNGNINIDSSYTDNLFIRPKSAGCGSGMICDINNSSITNSYVSNLDLYSDISNGGLTGMVRASVDSDINNSYVIDSIISNTGGLTTGLINSISGGSIENSHVINTEVVSLIFPQTSGFVDLASSNAVISKSSFRGGSVSSTGGNGGRTSGFINTITTGAMVSNSFFEGSVSASPSDTNSASLAGFFANGYDNDSAAITNSYFSGELSGSSEYINCFARGATTGISGSYYNNTRCTAGDTSGAVGLSDADMKISGSYSGWNINTPSCSEANDTNPWRWTTGNYPCLYSDIGCSCS
jgi:competence protein ComGC